MDVNYYLLVAGDIKGNMIYLSGSILSVGIGTVDIEAENLFLLFITWADHKLCYCIILLMRKLIGLSNRCSLCGNLVTYRVILCGSSTSYRAL